MRGPVALVFVERDGHLDDVHVGAGGLHDELRGELHAGRDKPKAEDHFALHAPHARIAVRDVCVEQPIQDARQHWRAQVTIQERHRARHDLAAKARTHDVLMPFANLVHKARELGEVVRVVGIPHEDVVAPGILEAELDRGPVTLVGALHDSRTGLLGNSDRVVRAAIVAHEDFASDRS